MHNFREDYKKAIKKLPEFHMDADRVSDELHHRKMVSARRRKTVISAVSAACVLILCSVGTVSALSYYSSRITVEGNGFSFLGKGAGTIEEMMEESPDGKDDSGMSMAQTMDGEGSLAKGNVEGSDFAEADGFFEAGGGAFDIEEEPAEGYASLEAEVEDIAERTYDTIEEFYSNEDILIAIPELEWLGDMSQLTQQQVIVSDGPFPMVYVSADFGEQSFFMTQMDNRESESYASSTVFSGDAVNERMLINDQGMEYQVFDSVENGEVISTHAAISINGRDLILNFFHYESSVVDAVLKQLDVSIYFIEE